MEHYTVIIGPLLPMECGYPEDFEANYCYFPGYGTSTLHSPQLKSWRDPGKTYCCSVSVLHGQRDTAGVPVFILADFHIGHSPELQGTGRL